MARTLVTGATGFIGSHVTRLLVDRGDDVLVTVRPQSRMDLLGSMPVTQIRADILDRRSIRRAMRGVDRVFHMAGAADLRAPRARVFSVVLEGTRTVLEEALRAGVERVVYTSSVAAVGPAPAGTTADEARPWEGGRHGIPYLDAKREAETVAMRLVARGLPLVIVNPAFVMGAGDPGRSSTVIVRRFLRREIPAFVDGTLNIVGVSDVARGHLLADTRGEIGERYILGNRNYTTQRLFADLARLSGVAAPEIKLPLPLALAAAAAGQWLGMAGMPTPTEVRAASLHWSFSSAKARRELGWRTSPHEDALEETIAWYRALEAGRLSPPGSRQPLPLRLAAGALHRVGL
jgi:dihydroflavonol-4-reductase